MHTPYGQRGMGLVGWMLSLIVFGFVVLVSLKLIPVYIDGYKVSSSMESLRSDTEPATSLAEVRARLLKRLDINMVDTVTARDISLRRDANNEVAVNVNYEVRKPLLGNIDVVISFDKTTEVPVRP